ncbi:hypothetical protein J7T55_004962 [Diaporthe amygdali]|uniref:uncharacterized protein n=1 Tax=Phomopsis amygdali TaxID=1214568 RepID=UPI0022FE30DF|nr:uncharacterized protein J7T55_004962 [Diaporthe amygdali]KAJ0114718.1 hypothetical protein J7T55_004962 [Diaporthe amygdali]
MASDLPDWLAPRSRGPRPDTPEDESTMEFGLDLTLTRELKMMSLGLSSISLLAGLLSIYWLVRMRRSFRHDDFTKSLCFVTYSSITFNRLMPLDSSSTFCQVSGFFFSMGVEASDAAVFLIALHWTVYIFRSNRAGDGIYPYRYSAFAFYILFPTLMASLAFCKGFPAYVDTGQYCYLPATPWWYRLSLSWIPRYVNVALIIIIRISFRIPMGGNLYESYSVSQADESIGFRESLRLRLDRLSISSVRSRGWHWQGLDWEPDRGPHSPSSGLVSPKTGPVDPTLEATETNYTLQPPRPSLSTLKRGGTVQTWPSRPFLSEGRKSSAFYRRPISTSMERVDKTGNRLNIGRRHQFDGSQMHIYTILQQGPSYEGRFNPTPSPSTLLDYETLESDGISRDRDRIRRQLRLLFVYPAVYACVWVFPFIIDVIGYDKDHNRSRYWILVASLVSMCVQGLADAIVFCVREKPWRHMNGGFWENLGMQFINGLRFESRNDIGRTREEMFHDSSRARLRREEEERERERTSRVSPSGTSFLASVSRNWWDIELYGDEEADSQDGKDAVKEWLGREMHSQRRSTQTG